MRQQRSNATTTAFDRKPRAATKRTLILPAGEDVDASDIRLRVAVLAGLGRGVVNDLAGKALDDDVAALLQGTRLDGNAVRSAGSGRFVRHRARGGLGGCAMANPDSDLLGDGSKAARLGGSGRALRTPSTPNRAV